METAALPWRSAATEEADLIFLDAGRPSCMAYLPHLARRLRPGGRLVTDNAVSHATEMAGFGRALAALPDWETSPVRVGEGELLALRP